MIGSDDWAKFERFQALGDGEIVPLHEARNPSFGQRAIGSVDRFGSGLASGLNRVANKIQTLPTKKQIIRRATVEYGKGKIANAGQHIANVGRVVIGKSRIPVTPMTKNRAVFKAFKSKMSNWAGV
jgi:hypothetical protein